MRIIIKGHEKPVIYLPVPSGMVLNRLTAGFAQKYLKEYGLDITKEQAASLIGEINRYRRAHPEWVLVEAQSADGEYVKIKL